MAHQELKIQETTLAHFQKIFIDEASINSEVAQRVLQQFPEDKIEILSSEQIQQQFAKGSMDAKSFRQSKRQLLLTPFRGQFFKRCPGASQKKTLNCCNYYVLNLGQQCNFDCSYCYLQSYLNSPVMKLYTNLQDALQELDEMASQFSEHPFRVGTGEVVDSLSLDDISLYSRHLIEFFRKYPKWILEFKTKSDKIDTFLDCQHAGNVVVSWSINPQYIITKEEHGTASLQQRLSAARRCLDAGYRIAFHIDPLIYHPEWKQNYGEFIDFLTASFRPEEVHVISLGALRFQPEQRYLMKERFGLDSLVTSAEMFPGEGAKLRYDASLRQEMFQFVRQRFVQNNSDWNVFLCMETPENWIATYEQTPLQIPSLKEFFRPLPKIRHTEDFENKGN